MTVLAVVLGESIRGPSIYSSTTMVLGEWEHDLSIMAMNCVEALYHTGEKTFSTRLPFTNAKIIGIHQSTLFRTPLNRPRLLEFVDSSVIRSRQISALTSQPIYLLYPPTLSIPPHWVWCRVDADGAESPQRHESSGRHLPSISLASSTRILWNPITFTPPSCSCTSSGGPTSPCWYTSSPFSAKGLGSRSKRTGCR